MDVPVGRSRGRHLDPVRQDDASADYPAEHWHDLVVQQKAYARRDLWRDPLFSADVDHWCIPLAGDPPYLTKRAAPARLQVRPRSTRPSEPRCRSSHGQTSGLYFCRCAERPGQEARTALAALLMASPPFARG